MNKLSCYLKFEISKYLRCQEYIKLYVVNKSFSEALYKDLDLKIPIFIVSHYVYDCDKDGARDERDVYGGQFHNLPDAIKCIKDDFDSFVRRKIKKKEIKEIQDNYLCHVDVNTSCREEDMYTREFKIESIPKRYIEIYEYSKFNLRKYVYNKILKLDLSKSDKLILEEVFNLHNLSSKKLHIKYTKIIEEDYLKGKINFDISKK